MKSLLTFIVNNYGYLKRKPRWSGDQVCQPARASLAHGPNARLVIHLRLIAQVRLPIFALRLEGGLGVRRGGRHAGDSVNVLVPPCCGLKGWQDGVPGTRVPERPKSGSAAPFQSGRVVA